MLKYLIERALEAAARRSDGDVRYFRAFYATSPRALRKMGKVTTLLAHREAVSAEAAYAAQLVGALMEDCGPCTQIHVNMARKAGVDDAQIEAVLRSDRPAMSADTALAVRFAGAIAVRSTDEEDARQAVRERWGEKGVVDLTFATQASRMLIMIKAGLGFATACERVKVGARTVDVFRLAG